MVIIRRDGDRLEVYNPWGFTEWVTADQFVNSQLGNLTDKDNLPWTPPSDWSFPSVDFLPLPKQGDSPQPRG